LQATVQPHPAPEPCDVVQLNDGALGTVVCQVGELHLM
jgi:hypothetical protein